MRFNRGSDTFIFSEVFEHRYYDFNLPNPPLTILDAGANVGFTALFLGRKYPAADLACVEPMPSNVALLSLNVTQNGLAAKIVPKALYERDELVIMRVADKDYGHKVANIGFGKVLVGHTAEVPGVTVSTLMTELGWERIGLLKMDIEGYEGVLLRKHPTWLEKVDALCIECHRGFGEADLIEIAAAFGFKRPHRFPGIWLMIR